MLKVPPLKLTLPVCLLFGVLPWAQPVSGVPAPDLREVFPSCGESD